jgi:hypothetical protein
MPTSAVFSTMRIVFCHVKAGSLGMVLQSTKHKEEDTPFRNALLIHH